MVKSMSSAFQIEYRPKDSPNPKPATDCFAFVRLLIGGYSIGSAEQVAYVPSFKNGLTRLLRIPPASARELAILASGEWKTWMFSDEVEGHYLVSLGETFDDFLILACRVESRLVFMWSLLDEPIFTYEDQLPGIPRKAEIEVHEVELRIQTFLRQH